MELAWPSSGKRGAMSAAVGEALSSEKLLPIFIFIDSVALKFSVTIRAVPASKYRAPCR